MASAIRVKTRLAGAMTLHPRRPHYQYKPHMDIFNITALEYYLAHDVKKSHKALFRGCLASLGKIIERYELTSEYVYAREVNGSLVPGNRIFTRQIIFEQGMG